MRSLVQERREKDHRWNRLKGRQMRLVAQISPYTCPLACLESFLFDLGHSITQDEIIRLHPDLCIPADPAKRHEIGALSVPIFEQLCGRLGIQCTSHKDFRQTETEADLSSLPPHSTVVIIINHPTGTHMVRFAGIQSPGSWLVMDPQFQHAQFRPISFQDLVKWNFSFCILTRI